MSVEALSGKVFLLITGASRGIGRQIAITFGSLLEEGSRILLLARNKVALQEVAKNIPSKVNVCRIFKSIDLSKSTDTELKEMQSLGEKQFYIYDVLESILEYLEGTTCNAFDRVVLVHNVGITGDISQFVNNMLDVNTWREFYDVNFFIPAVLNAVVMNMFDDKNIKKTVINISSVCAIKEAIGLSQYCSAKAAREMYFKVFALENPDVNVLSYAPGHVDTDMLTQACETIVDPTLKKIFNEIREKKTVLTTEQTVNRLVQILKEHKYKSADHVDYYDEL